MRLNFFCWRYFSFGGWVRFWFDLFFIGSFGGFGFFVVLFVCGVKGEILFGCCWLRWNYFFVRFLIMDWVVVMEMVGGILLWIWRVVNSRRFRIIDSNIRVVCEKYCGVIIIMWGVCWVVSGVWFEICCVLIRNKILERNWW